MRLLKKYWWVLVIGGVAVVAWYLYSNRSESTAIPAGG